MTIKLLILFLVLMRLSSQHAGWKTINTIKSINEQPIVKSASRGTSEDQYFSQKLDHFNIHNKQTFYQRYAYNYNYYKIMNELVILYVEGEAPMNENRLESGFAVDLAKKYGAFLVHLEHRFYGESVPGKKLDSENLKYLTADQALEDLVEFVNHLNSRFFSYGVPKYIIVGGSYSGMLSSWARIKYPHVFYASIASSAPVHAKLEFSSYEKVVSNSMKNTNVGGSDLCAKVVQEAFTIVDKYINIENNESTNKLIKKMGMCNVPLTKSDWWVFSDNLRGIFDGAVQYNTNDKEINIKNLCDIMTTEELEDDDDYLDALSNVVSFYFEESGEDCLDASYTEYLDMLKSDKVTSEKAWYYQTCSEFGFYQDCTADSNCLFSKSYSVNYDMAVCLDAFGINTHMISGYIELTNKRFGSTNPQTSRIIYINGDIDPWHSLGVMGDRSSLEQTVIYTEDASHCQELHAASETDPKSLLETRKKIDQIVGEWVTSD